MNSEKTSETVTPMVVGLDRKVRHELDRFKPKTDAKSMRGKCEGGCEEHYGIVKTVRVFDKKSGADWGYFSYCEAAILEDTENRGMEIESA